MTTAAASNRATHAAFVRALLGADPGITRYLHPELVVHEPADLPYGGEYHGPDGFLELVARLGAIFELQVLDSDIMQPGERVVGVMTIRLTHRAQRAEIVTKVVEIYTFRDGLISELDMYYKDPKAVCELIAACA